MSYAASFKSTEIKRSYTFFSYLWLVFNLYDIYVKNLAHTFLLRSSIPADSKFI